MFFVVVVFAVLTRRHTTCDIQNCIQERKITKTAANILKIAANEKEIFVALIPSSVRFFLQLCSTHTRTYTHRVRTHTHTHSDTHAFRHTCSYMPTHRHANTHVYTHAFTHAQAFTHPFTHTRSHTNTHTHTHVHTHTRVHRHTFIHAHAFTHAHRLTFTLPHTHFYLDFIILLFLLLALSTILFIIWN